MTTRGWNLPSRVIVGALLVVHALMAWAMRVPGLATGHDDAWYIVLARALRRGTYVELPIVGHPAHAMYPPLYPALLAVLGVSDPGHVWIGVMANVALSVLTLVMVANVAVRLSPWLAVAVTLVCAVNPMVLYVASGIHSEPMLAATAAIAIAVAAAGRRDAGAVALLTLMAIAAALSRTIGLALVVSTFALFAFERRWRALAIFSAAAALAVGSWLVWTVKAPRLDAGRSYISDAVFSPRDTASADTASADTASADTAARDSVRAVGAAIPVTPRVAAPNSLSHTAPSPTAELDSGRAAAAREEVAAERVAAARAAAAARFARTLAARLVHNVPAYLTREFPTVFAIPTREGTRADNVVWLLVFLVTAVVGFAVLIRKAWLLTAYLAVSMAVLLLWPYVDKRFLAPLIPWVALAMLVGVWWIGERTLGAGVARLAMAGSALLLAGVALQNDADRLTRVASCDRAAAMTSPGCFNDEQRDFFAAALAARRLTADTSRFLVSKEATFYLLSGRESVRESEAVAKRTPAELRRFLEEQRVGYILLSRLHLDQWALAATLVPQCQELELVASFGAHVALLRLPPSPPTAPDSVPPVAVAVPDTFTPPPSAAAASPAAAATDTGSTPWRNGCDAIARWNAGTWDSPPVRIW